MLKSDINFRNAVLVSEPERHHGRILLPLTDLNGKISNKQEGKRDQVIQVSPSSLPNFSLLQFHLHFPSSHLLHLSLLSSFKHTCTFLFPFLIFLLFFHTFIFSISFLLCINFNSSPSLAKPRNISLVCIFVREVDTIKFISHLIFKYIFSSHLCC